MNISVILSGGVGVRFGDERPKQYQSLLGREIIEYVVDALKQSLSTDKTIIVSGKDDMQRLRAIYGVGCAEAGETHNASVKSGLDFVKAHYPACKRLLFVDAARPFLTAELVDEYFAMLDVHDAVITTQYITDSLGKADERFTDRSDYYLIQKPEAFRFDALYTCFSAEMLTTAIVQQLPPQADVYRRFGVRQNLKVTYPEDLPLAEYLMKIRQNKGG